MNNMLKRVFLSAATAVLLLSAMFAGCEKWTEPQAKQYIKPEHTEAQKQNIKDYLASPHRIMFGWYASPSAWSGKTTGTSKKGSLMGLPDSIDHVCLWLTMGNVTDAQVEDLKDFHALGHTTAMCWTPANIGQNYTPEGENAAEFWGYADGTEESYVAAAEKYAMAIVDTVRKYGLGGFESDMENTGTLINFNRPDRYNAFCRVLINEFKKDGNIFAVDIPGGTGWLSYYDILADDVIEEIRYFAWQTYDFNSFSQINNFFEGSGGVRARKPHMYDTVLAKSILCTTFERGNTDKNKFLAQINVDYASPSTGIKPLGYGAYHMEQDFDSDYGYDYPTVRRGISLLNPPIYE